LTRTVKFVARSDNILIYALQTGGSSL